MGLFNHIFGNSQPSLRRFYPQKLKKYVVVAGFFTPLNIKLTLWIRSHYTHGLPASENVLHSNNPRLMPDQGHKVPVTP